MYLKLMIPGPIEVEDEVLEWMGAPVRVHYGDDWVAIHNETIKLLGQIFATGGKVFMMPGSGSLAIDAAVQSTFKPGDKVALGINGNFGNRMCEIMVANGLDVVRIDTEPTQPLDPTRFEQALVNDPSIVAVAAVHLETSTAVLNPAREIAEVARRHNRLCLIDAVASLAGTELKMDEWGIDVCVSASQKGLGGVPGLALVAVGERAWSVIAGQPDYPRSWYLDLRRWQWYVENWGDWHPFPVTMPTSVVLGLRAALQSLIREGVEQRFQTYDRLAKLLRDGLAALDMSLFVSPSLMAPVLTAVYCPPGVTASQIVSYLANKHRIKITTGFGPFRDSVIRIGHMGGALKEADIIALLEALKQFMVEREKWSA